MQPSFSLNAEAIIYCLSLFSFGFEGNCGTSDLGKRRSPMKPSEGESVSRPRGFPRCSFLFFYNQNTQGLSNSVKSVRVVLIMNFSFSLFVKMKVKCFWNVIIFCIYCISAGLSSSWCRTSALAACPVPPQGQLPCTQIYNITEVIKDLGTTQGRKVRHFKEIVGGISASNEQLVSFDLPLIQRINL